MKYTWYLMSGVLQCKCGTCVPTYKTHGGPEKHRGEDVSMLDWVGTAASFLHPLFWINVTLAWCHLNQHIAVSTPYVLPLYLSAPFTILFPVIYNRHTNVPAIYFPAKCTVCDSTTRVIEMHTHTHTGINIQTEMLKSNVKGTSKRIKNRRGYVTDIHTTCMKEFRKLKSKRKVRDNLIRYNRGFFCR